MAERLEYASAEFYQQASKLVSDKATQHVLQNLASDELEHQIFFRDLRSEYKEMLSKTVDAATEDSIRNYVDAFQDYRVFDFDFTIKQTIKGNENVPKIIQMAIGFEKNQIVFCSGLMNIYEDKSFHELLKKIIREEFGHLSLLTNISFM